MLDLMLHADIGTRLNATEKCHLGYFLHPHSSEKAMFSTNKNTTVFSHGDLQALSTKGSNLTLSFAISKVGEYHILLISKKVIYSINVKQ